ncbi:hypothetical protein AYO40_03205 [Planctomycetaceae bacterium SCGC AG-212-D15]|nr:hypothetical protein AYO40_03205 [Planctomycetaceae bacterium SCGC AG-212-D15]
MGVLTPNDLARMRRWRDDGLMLAQIGAKLGVTPQAVSMALQGRFKTLMGEPHSRPANSFVLQSADLLVPIMSRLVSFEAMLAELNARKIPSFRNRGWTVHKASACYQTLVEAGLLPPRSDARRAETNRIHQIIGPTALELREAGFTLAAIAKELSRRGMRTHRGLMWQLHNVHRLLRTTTRSRAGSWPTTL